MNAGLSSPSDYPFDRFLEILERADIELSPIELAEILWMRLQSPEEDTVTPPDPAPESRPKIHWMRLQSPEEDTVTPPDPAPESRPKIHRDPPDNFSLPPPPPPPDRQPERTSEQNFKAVTEPPTKAIGGGKSPLTVRLPDAIALRNRRAIARSLRPLLRKVPSRSRESVDEEATALQIAESRIPLLKISPSPQTQDFQKWCPVFRPDLERWLDLAVVVEITSVYQVWQDTIEEFGQILERCGAFRDVRTWQIRTDKEGKTGLYLQTRSGVKAKPRSPKELLDPGGRRLLLFISDCTSKAWRSGEIPRELSVWGQKNPLAILQLLPFHYWDRTVTGACPIVGLRSRKPGPVNTDWKISGISPWERQYVGPALTVPVITLHPDELNPWAKAIATEEGRPITGILLKSDQYPARETTPPLSTETTPQRLVRDFRGTASLQARELADRLAVLPITWPVIRLVQKNWDQHDSDSLQDTNTIFLAEIFLCRLIEFADEPIAEKKQRDRQQYHFIEGVREVLLGGISRTEAFDVAETVAEKVFQGLPPDFQERINNDIAKRYGEALSYFEAFLVPDLDWGEHVGEILPFASVNGQILRSWGGEYASWADELEGRVQSSPPDGKTPEDDEEFEYTVASLIVLDTLDFEIATITVDDSLQPFTFDVATLERGKRSRLTVYHQQRQAWQFIEDLGQGVQLKMVSIPEGKSLMGAPPDEEDSSDYERPQHEVEISPFFLGKYPVTQAQWRAVAAFPRINRNLTPDPSGFTGDDLPVERVSWYDAVEFCRRLSRETGRTYRLPSEAEWEYACRAGTTTPFHFGETISTDLANYDGNSTYSEGIKGTYQEKTTPVGYFKVANAFGLYDMHGNVWEWCEDDWHDSYEGAPTDGTAWIAENGEKSPEKLLRGGSWCFDPDACRSAYRYRLAPAHGLNLVGFRVSCAVSRTL